jgi:hypothetical protein
MSWRRQNVLSVIAIVVLVALNTLLPAPESASKGSRAVIASSQR